jgi:hypothetical protein
LFGDLFAGDFMGPGLVFGPETPDTYERHLPVSATPIEQPLFGPETPDTYERHLPVSATPTEQPHDVEEVLDRRIMHGKKQYFVKYVGLPIMRCEWIDPHSAENAREKFQQFDQAGPVRSMEKKR